MYVAGSNRHGQLGLGSDIESTSRPTPIPLVASMPTSSSPDFVGTKQLPVTVSHVCCGYHHTFVFGSINSPSTSTPVLLALGRNHRGQLGLGHTRSTRVPTPVKFPDGFALGTSGISIACGTDHSILVDSAGKAWSCGGNGVGQLGLGMMSMGVLSSSDRPIRKREVFFQNITTVNSIRMCDCACGGTHSMLVGEGGRKVFGFGSNRFGQLGVRALPNLGDGDDDTVAVEVPSSSSSLSLGELTGPASGSGSAQDSDMTDPVAIPTEVQGLNLGEKRRVRSVCCGFYFTIFVVETNQAQEEGEEEGEEEGKMGKSEAVEEEEVEVEETAEIRIDDEIWATGENTYGELGFLSRDGHLLRCVGIPCRVVLPHEQLPKHLPFKVASLSCGDDHVCLVTQEGNVIVWGRNKYGQCGIDVATRTEAGVRIAEVVLEVEASPTTTEGHSNATQDEVVPVSDSPSDPRSPISSIETKEFIILPTVLSCLSAGRPENPRELYPLEVCCGGNFTVVRTNEDFAFFGANKYGQLCAGDKLPKSNPQLINFFGAASRSPRLVRKKKRRNRRAGGQGEVAEAESLESVPPLSLDDPKTPVASRSLPGASAAGLPRSSVEHQSRHAWVSGMACGFGHVVFLVSVQEKEFACHDELREALEKLYQYSVGAVDDGDLDSRAIHFKDYVIAEDDERIRFPVLLDFVLARFPRLFRRFVPKRRRSSKRRHDQGAGTLVHLPGSSRRQIEILLHFVYVGSLPEETLPGDTEELLGLLILCGEAGSLRLSVLSIHRIITDVTLDNIIQLMKAMRDLKESVSANLLMEWLHSFRRHLIVQVKELIDATDEGESSVPGIDDLDRLELMEIVLRSSKYKKLSLEECVAPPESVLSCLKRLFKSQVGGNIHIGLDRNGREQKIVAHRELLAVRCPHFATLFQFKRRASNQASSLGSTSPPRFLSEMDEHQKELEEEIQMHVLFQLTEDEDISHFAWVCRQFVQYLYTGEIRVDRTNAVALIMVWNVMGMDTSHEISLGGQQIIANGLTVDNVFQIFEAFINGKENVFQELERECVELCVKNWRFLNARFGKKIMKFLPYQQYVRITQKHL